MIFITSDLHFGHNKEFLYGPRGFSSIEEHDEEIIKRWNSVVGSRDYVYILGDVMLGDNETGLEKLKSLNGNKILIRGNHDTDTRWKMYQECYTNPIITIGYADMIKHGKYHFYLSHYPTAIGNYDDKIRHSKTYCLCGHTHTQDKWKDFATMKSYHIELDAHNCYPVLLDNIIEDIKNFEN